MASRDDRPVSFTRASSRRIARAVRHFEGRGRGEAPPPRRRRDTGGGGGSGGGAGEVGFDFGRVVEEISAATGWAREDWGTGQIQRVDDDGEDVGDPIVVQNRYPNSVPVDSAAWFLAKDNDFFYVNSGCLTFG